jgi:hypothetical protein
MSMRYGKRFDPFVKFDVGFDPDEAWITMPKVFKQVLETDFSTYTKKQLDSLSHQVAVVIAHKITDELCNKYPYESYNKLSRWADYFSHKQLQSVLA